MSNDPSSGAGDVPSLAPRPVRSHAQGFSIPWQMLRQGALHFQSRMHAAQTTQSDPVENWHWDSYALATQVFSAMAAEAQLNTYGLVRFGEETFERQFRRKGPVERLKRMAAEGAGVALADSDALVRTLVALIKKRNPIVHMQAKEEEFDQGGHIIRPAHPPPNHLQDADRAVQEMETFLQGFGTLIGQHDIESWEFVAPW